ncbi:MAG TPA: DUF3268 family zinc-finger domain-containing protein [Candidatus Levilactobacillus faecigallinarum]|uniref:DUF3268 family zinc-finger domain-containing protein n=1 Tax=Candidatus Levilactobacillus faecigallinarum TaxID=2838638 RepID=A0A9D1QV36_9LACO|nr:DUF3268 family zinc-finger domain-containing protein [Candidatus Levilactobacillus faecigallinarum]
MDANKFVDSLTAPPIRWDEVLCPYCGGEVVWTSNREIYGREYGNGRCYLCTECGACVGVHDNGKGKGSRRALGLLATPEMRKMKQKCHARFDAVWHTHKRSRAACYRQLAKLMGISVRQCHFGYFNLADLNRAYQIMAPFHWYEEKLKKVGA